MSNINLSNFETGDSSFQDLYVYGKLNYDFKDDDVTVKSINVTSPSVFSGDVAFSGDITLDEITCRNANVTGIATVGTSLYIQGKLFDGDGDFGTAGQLLSSDGTDLNWIDANTTSVANSINVGTNLNSTDADQFITFVGSNSGNNPIRVDNDLKYNPSTNTLTAGFFAGDGSALSGVESFVTGMIILWYGNTSNIPNGFALCDGTQETPDLRSRFIIGADADATINGVVLPTTSVTGAATTTGGSKDAVVVEHKHTTTVDDDILFPASGGVTFPYGGAGGYPGTIFSMDNEGVSGTNKNLPPYHALCFIMKT